MKKTFKLIGIIAVVAIIGLSAAACSSDPAPLPIYGTWVAGGERIVLEDGNWTLWYDNQPYLRGTFIASDGYSGTFTLTVVEINVNGIWINQSTAIVQGIDPEEFLPMTGTFTITGTALTMSDIGTFHRQ